MNGSFVTDKLEPNDVDCVLLVEPGFPRDSADEAELAAGLPFINMELVNLNAFREFTQKTFATDRDLVPKGMVEVILIENRWQLENTRAKLADLEQLYERERQQTPEDAHIRELTLRSIKKRINQFTEEVALFAARTSSSTKRSD